MNNNYTLLLTNKQDYALLHKNLVTHEATPALCHNTKHRHPIPASKLHIIKT
ncbi:hypothetical protein [Porphyromonas pogonae]|uniref:hypothetical protein n=1 Tax=Porphyromonas pogonae TaxID=867595 RepID=UPI002E788655|nr:hypothetical protein [Porphyromonas pogonae]